MQLLMQEEKKNRIKMEISRRRNQIEENARLHEELIRLAKLRETAELGIGGAVDASGAANVAATSVASRLAAAAAVTGYHSPSGASPHSGPHHHQGRR